MMSLSRIAAAVNYHRKLVLMFMLIALASAWVADFNIVPTYKAKTSLILNYKGSDALMGPTSPGQTTSGYLPTYIATQADIIKSMSVAAQVVDLLNLTQSKLYHDELAISGIVDKSEQRDFIAQLLVKNLDVKPSRESSVLDITVKNKNPVLASQIANTYVTVYRKTAVDLEASPIANAAVYFEEQLKTLRTYLDIAQQKVSRYQKENGIVNADTRADVETARLNDLSTQLVMVQTQKMDARARNTYAAASGSESSDIENNSLVQSLRAEISRAEVKRGLLEQKYTPGDLFYKEIDTELSQLRSELHQQMARTSRTVANTASIVDRREMSLRDAVSLQKVRVLDLNRKRDELQLLLKDVEGAQKEYDNVGQRLAQTKLLSQAKQSDVTLLNVANTPRQSTSLQLPVMLVLAALIGLLVGTAVATAIELLSTKIRSARDLHGIDNLPVLSVLGSIRPAMKVTTAKTLGYTKYA